MRSDFLGFLAFKTHLDRLSSDIAVEELFTYAFSRLEWVSFRT